MTDLNWNPIDDARKLVLDGKSTHIAETFKSHFTRIRPGHYTLSSLNAFLEREKRIDQIVIDTETIREHIPENEVKEVEQTPVWYRVEDQTFKAGLKAASFEEIGLEKAKSLLVSPDTHKRKFVSKHIEIRERSA